MSKIDSLRIKFAVMIAAIRSLYASSLSAFLASNNGVAKFAVNRKGMTGRLLMVVINVYVVASIVPGALVYLTNATNWTGVPAPVLTLGTTVLSIVVVTVIIIMFLRSGGISD